MAYVQPTFVNSFWGKHEEGVEVLMKKLRTSKQSCVELQYMYTARATIEEEYGKKLLNLAQSPIGKDEFGTLKESIEGLRRELESMGSSRIELGRKMKAEIEGELTNFMEIQREKRKAQTTKIEKCAKDKSMIRAHVLKLKERLDLENRIMQELDHLGDGEKLQKAVTSARITEEELREALRRCKEIERQWISDWKESCELFQRLEEERINFLKKSCWDFSNTIATVCVSDDMACENMRQSLEKCYAVHDIAQFIQEFGTGSELPDSLYTKEVHSQGPRDSDELNSRSKLRSSTGQISNNPQIHTPIDRPASAMYDPRYYYYSGTPDPAMAYRQAAYYHQSRGYYPMDPRNTAAMGYRPPVAYHNRPIDYSQVPGRAVSPNPSQHPMMYYSMVQGRPPWQKFTNLQGQPKGGLIKASDPSGGVTSPPPTIITTPVNHKKDEPTSNHPVGNKLDPQQALSPTSTDTHYAAESKTSSTSMITLPSSDCESRTTSPNSKVYPTPDSPQGTGNDALRSPIQQKRGRGLSFKNYGLYSPVNTSPDRSSPTKISPPDDASHPSKKIQEDPVNSTYATSGGQDTEPGRAKFNNHQTDLSSGLIISKDEVIESPSETAQPEQTTRPSKSRLDTLKPHMEVRALYDYEAECEEELSLREGQIVRVTATRLDGWWEGEILDENQIIQSGLFPSNFTEPVINLDYI